MDYVEGLIHPCPERQTLYTHLRWQCLSLLGLDRLFQFLITSPLELLAVPLNRDLLCLGSLSSLQADGFCYWVIFQRKGVSLFSVMPPLVLVCQAGRCWCGEGVCCTGARACPSLGWSSTGSSLSVMDIGSNTPGSRFEAKVPPSSVTNNIHF